MIEVVLTSYICTLEECRLFVEVLEDIQSCQIINLFTEGILRELEEGSWFLCEERVKE